MKVFMFILLCAVGVAAQTAMQPFSASGIGSPSGACSGGSYQDRSTSLWYNCNQVTHAWESATSPFITPPLAESQVTNLVSDLAGKAAIDLSNVSGTINIGNFPATQPVTGTFWQATQPISVSALPLPSGASTEATLALIKAKTDNLDVLLSTRTKPADTQNVAGTVTANAGTNLNTSNLDVALSTRLKPADTLAGVTTLGSITNPVYTQEGSATRWSCFVTAATVTTQCQAAAGAGLRNYVTSIAISNQAATVQTVDVIYGTGANCATSPIALTHKWQLGTNGTTTSPFAIDHQFQTPLVPAMAQAICVRPSAATAFGVTITGYTAP